MFKKKHIPRILIFILVYIVIRFPAGLLENWVMGEVLEQVENTGISFLIIWILPIFAAIGLIAIAVWILGLIREIKIKAIGEYQPQKSGFNDVIDIADSVSRILGKAGGLKFELNTNNKKDFSLEAKVPIQSARFTKPEEKVVRPDFLPVNIECEKSFWKRMRNKMLSVPKPRIVIKRFTKMGIIWDEENTNGADVAVEYYPK